MRLQVHARRAQPIESQELERLEEAVARSLAPHAPRLQRVVVSVEGARLLRLRGEVFHDGGCLRVEHIDAGELAEAAHYFADRMGRAVARTFSVRRTQSKGRRGR